MTRILLACTLLAGLAAAAPANANVCRTDAGKTCATGMPIDGYCECSGQGGTVVQAAMAPSHMTHRVSHPDCQANPQAPGCPKQ